jgi:hypothetical protein
MPLPHANLEGRSGLPRLLERPVDVNYGLNATGIAFGILQAHVGMSWLLVEERGFWPALSVTNRVFLAANVLGVGDRAPGSVGFWGADQLELTASYLFGQQLVYAGLGQYFDFQSPRLLLTPSLGVVVDPGAVDGWRLFIEGRYFAINQTKELVTVRWVPESRGALGVAMGLSYTF